MSAFPIGLAAHTFPIWPVKDGVCACKNGAACTRPGKHPRCSWTSFDPAAYNFSPEEGSQYGIRTGKGSGIFVVDCDEMSAVESFVAEFPEALDTYMVETASGAHFYFQHPGFPILTSKNVLGEGIDVRGDGGFAVGPGSIHKTGVMYAVGNDLPIARASDGLALACKKDDTRESGDAVTPIGVDHPYYAERLKKWWDAVATWPADGSVNLLNLAQTGVRTYELPDSDVEDGLETYNERCSPRWTTSELDHKLTDARNIGTFQIGAGEAVRDALKEAIERAIARQEEQAFEAAEETREMRAKPRKQQVTGWVHPYEIGQAMDLEVKPTKISRTKLLSNLTMLPDWEGVLQEDEFKGRIYAVDPPVHMKGAEKGAVTTSDANAACAWFEHMGCIVSDEAMWKAMVLVAEQNGYHPVREYLDGLDPAGSPGLLDDLATRVFGVTGRWENDFLKKFLIGAVRRIDNPGVQMDNVLLLVGEQAAKKSSFVRALFGHEKGHEERKWFRTQVPALDKTDASLAVSGFWCLELGEMHRVISQDSSVVKEFITRTVDDFRKPYGRVEVSQPRQCVLIGTTNHEECLIDATGDRRWWPIQSNDVNVDLVAELRDSIWAEARRLARAGEQHWYSKEDEAIIARDVHVLYKSEDSRTSLVASYLGRIKATEVTVMEVWTNALAGEAKDIKKPDEMRIAAILRALGCSKAALTRGAPRHWLVAEAIIEARVKPKASAA
jgi:predicted P-loop ATPase